MARGDIIGLVLSYVYAFGLLLLIEAIGKRFKWPQHVTRKIIHIGAGMWIWGILYFFETWILGLIPFATFIVLNYIFYRQGTFEQMDEADSSPGTVYFAFSITVLFALFWRPDSAFDRVHIAAAAVMAMTWGDALASLVGRAFGERTYTVFGHTRTWEGSAVMAVTSFAAVFLTLWLLPGSALSPNGIKVYTAGAAIMAAFAALVATLAEAVTPAGLDNLSVPLLTGLALYLLWLLTVS